MQVGAVMRNDDEGTGYIEGMRLGCRHALEVAGLFCTVFRLLAANTHPAPFSAPT